MVCYTFRLIYYSMRGGFNLRRFSNISDPNFIITFPILFLRVGGGAMISWVIFPEFYMICLSFMKVLVVSFLGAFIGYYLNMVSRIKVNDKLD